jgi:putative ubiquitin-RnfH superfamily antitoxin RatB of RatAB toxin-antitoxin module
MENIGEWITISVVYASQNQCVMRDFRLPADSTVADVLIMANASGAFPPNENISCAIFGQRAELTTPLRDGDRIELLRPLCYGSKKGANLLPNRIG